MKLSVLLVFMLAACASRPDPSPAYIHYDRSRGPTPGVAKAEREWMAAIAVYSAKLDDGVSDASTIGRAVSSAVTSHRMKMRNQMLADNYSPAFTNTYISALGQHEAELAETAVLHNRTKRRAK